MSFPLYMLLPLAASVMYAYGSLYFKEAFEHGISVIHTFVISSGVMAIVFVPMLFFDPFPASPRQVVHPLAAALLFVTGNWLTFAAIRRGDISVIVPVMGTKSFFVALGAATFFGKDIAPGMWTAAALAAVGVYVLGRTDDKDSSTFSWPIVLTILSSSCFGICDAMVQAWAPDYGSRGFMGTMFAFIALLSGLTLRLAETPLKRADRQGLRALFIGATIVALQGILVAISVVSFDNATGVNVVYSSRGLWSVLMIWWLSHRFQFDERHQDRRRLITRLIGATIMMLAVGLALWESTD